MEPVFGTTSDGKNPYYRSKLARSATHSLTCRIVSVTQVGRCVAAKLYVPLLTDLPGDIHLTLYTHQSHVELLIPRVTDFTSDFHHFTDGPFHRRR